MKAVVEKREIKAPAECKRRITVFHLIGSLRVGGAEQQLVSLVPLFDREKFRIIVGTLQPGGGLENVLAESGIEYVNLSFRVRTFVQCMLRLAGILRREKVDILHTHIAYTSFFGRLAGLCSRVPFMVTTDHGQHLWKKRWEVMADWALNRFTACRVAVTGDVAEILHTRDHTPRNKIIVVPNGVDVERFRVDSSRGKAVRKELGISDDTVVVGTVARLSWAKALEVLVETTAELVKRLPKVRCVIVGDGSLRGEVEQCVKDLGMQDYVLMTGTRMDVPELLSAFDVFVLSSRTEGLPVSLLEAMAAGRPIASTRVGGIPEVVTDRKEALLVEPGDPHALADAIVEIVSDPRLAAELARNAEERVGAEYSIAATVRKLERVYCDLLSKRRQ